ncbi:MAG: T9SS type A sorting domain-containing protein, partial [Hymenobacter sp.]
PSTATLPTPLVVPGTNTSFRGVALAPVATALAARPAGAALAAEVYPVPAAHQLLVQLPASGAGASVQVALFNSLGQQVRHQQLPVPASGAPLALAVADLPNGVYTLRLLMGGQAVSKQVVILN